MYSLTRKPALSGPIITPGINRCGPFHKLGKFCKVGSICSSAFLSSHKPDSLASSSPSDGSSSNCFLQDSLRSERQEPSTRNSRCCKSIGALKRHDKPLDGLPQLPRLELANLNRNEISSERIVKKQELSRTSGSSKRKQVSSHRSHRRIEQSGSFNERNTKYRVTRKKHNKQVSKLLPSMIGRRNLSKKRKKVSKRRPPVSTSRLNKKSKLNDWCFYHAINQEEPDIGTVEHTGVQGGGDNKREEELYKAELKPLQGQGGQEVEAQLQQNEDTLWSRVFAKWKRMPTWKKTVAVVTSASVLGIGIGAAAYSTLGANSNLSSASASHGNESINNFPFPMKEGTTSTGVPSNVYPMNPNVRPTGDLPILSNERTALMDAAWNGNLQVVEELINSGATVDQQNLVGLTALMWAAGDGHLQIVAKLIESGADVNHKKNNGLTALMWAADYGHLQVVEKLIESKANVNEKDNDGLTALMWAVRSGDPQVVEKLIESKANVNEKDNDGWTALTFSVEHGYSDIEYLLCKSGAKGCS